MVLSLSILLATSVSVTPSQLPARGHQEAVITADQPSMVHIETSGSTGVQCTVADQLRGPFATAGAIGHARCALDLLLDASQYKVRLEAPRKGKGKLELKAIAFKDVRPASDALDVGTSADLTLHPREQASFWVRIDQRKFVTLRVAGRTAGRIELWRDGRWREEVEATDRSPMPTPGQPIHEWWITRFLEAGNYLLTVYGVDETHWTSGTESDAVTVSNGFLPAGAAHSESFIIPLTGVIGFTLPAGPATTLLSLPVASSVETKAQLYSLADDDSVDIQGSVTSTCAIQPRSQIPECSTYTTSDKVRHVVLVRGLPGTSGRLQWIVTSSDEIGDGSFGWSTDVRFRAPKSSRYLVGTTDLPPDLDAAPLSCRLWEEFDREPSVVIGSDLLEVSPKKPFQRRMNFANNATVWFRVTEGSEYQLNTTGEHADTCELYRMEGAGNTRLSKSTPNQKKCDLHSSLSPGEYRLDLYGPKPGIETVTIAPSGATSKESSTKAGCLIPDVALQGGHRYRLELSRLGNVANRGLLLRPASESLPAPLMLTLDNGHYIRVPISAGTKVEVLVPTGSISCGMAQGRPVDSADGVCRPENSEAGGLLVITPKSQDPVQVVVAPVVPPTASRPLASYNPKLLDPPRLPLDEPQFFDFDRNESHSLVFEVKQPGLYDVTTEGLLATECTMRTAVVPALGSNAGGGRGHNCLLEQYLRPGQYLVTTRTTGTSKGRASIVLHRRPPRQAAPVSADGDAFFRADAGELIQQQLTVKKAGRMQLSTTDRGVPNQCRLEDAQGWPLLAVPASCGETLDLEKGTYLWTQLPLTVETMRHTRLAREKPPRIFSGNKVHALPFNEWSDARLRKSGKDEFFFELQAEADVTITLTNRMQGRLYLINPDKSLKPVDIVPPEGGASTSEAPSSPNAPAEMEGDGEGGGEIEEAPAEPIEREYGDEGGGDGEAAQPEYQPPPRAPEVLVAAPPVALPPGHVVHLPPGPYKFITEHSQGDVAIRYRLFLGTELLIPGVARTLTAPTFLTLRMPADGTARLLTTGETDVRCRLFDASGRLVTESDHNGEDWNCALAEPLPKGDYRLVIESETLTAGETTVALTMPKVDAPSAFCTNCTVDLATNVAAMNVGPLPEDKVESLWLHGTDDFSCALDAPDGSLLDKQLNVKDCSLILKPKAGLYRLRMWTLGRPARVTVNAAQLQVANHDDGVTEKGVASRAVIKSAGLYETSANTLCLPESTSGVFLPCGGTVSLDAGPTLFAAPGNERLEKPLREVVLSGDAPEQFHGLVSTRPFIQRHEATREAIHLLRVSVPPGEQQAPACSIDGGISALHPTSCIAASRVTRSAVERWWAPQSFGLQADVLRATAIVPGSSSALGPGKRTLFWEGTTARYDLPSQTHRIDLTLPAEGWAVRIEPNGSVGDLCAAESGLSRCLVSGRGGQLYLYSPTESRADVTVILTGESSGPQRLTTVAEELLPEASTLHYEIPADRAQRIVRVEGAQHCLLILEDGVRTAGCSLPLPADQGAELILEADAGAVRASVGPTEKSEQSRFGQAIPTGSAQWLPWSETASLGGPLVDRSFSLNQEGVVHIRGDSGVCALTSGTDFLETTGSGGSCEIHRLLGPGTYRLLVRPFGRLALTGQVSWTTEGVEVLKDGVGPEAWLAAGQQKRYRFTTTSAGKVGLGLQVPAETLECRILDKAQHVLGEGCQQYLSLDAGDFLLSVRAPAGVAPTRFQPVLLGLAGARMNVPEEYLRDFFQRIGEAP